MNNPLTTDGRTGRILCVLSVIAITIFLTCQPAKGQIRIAAAAGVIDKPMLVGQLNVGYESKSFFGSADLVRQAIKTGTWFGIKSGYIINVNDQTNLRIYSGLQYKVTGNKHSIDRYVHDGQTEVLSTGKEVNSIYVPIGIQVTRGALFIDAGAMAGKEVNFMITVGINHLFNK
jgi:hypothetical protein